MADIRVTNAAVLAASDITPTVEVTGLYALVAANFPSEGVRVTNAAALVTTTSSNPIEVSQLAVLAAVRGRIENRRLRAWAFSLDGHDFYVLRLGESSTLVYDLTTGQWSTWSSPDLPFWRAHVGMNWLGVGREAYLDGASSKVVAGDDSFGVLWTLDPDQGYDDHARYEGQQKAFTRRVVGGVPMRLRETQKVGAVYVTLSLGNPAITGAEITLRTSDDNGKTWINHGTIEVTPDDWDQEIAWRSIGLIRAPGRIFELTDDGAAVRIDGLDIR